MFPKEGLRAQGSLHHSPSPSYPHNNNPVRKDVRAHPYTSMDGDEITDLVSRQLHGYMDNKPLGLQIFIGTADERILKPHAFYQVHRITGKTVTTTSYEKILGNTKVLEIPLEPKNNMKATIDCAGILKLRNADIELRKGETDIGRKNTRVRLVFRVHIPESSGRIISLQVASNPIECSQRSAHELPMIERQDVDSCLVYGGQQMILTGQNFTAESKVVFTEKTPELEVDYSILLLLSILSPQQQPHEAGWAESLTGPKLIKLSVDLILKEDPMCHKYLHESDGQQIWEMEATVDKDKSQPNMLFVEIPEYRNKHIRTSVKVNFYVINGKRKKSQPQHFTYHPVPSIKTEPIDDYDPSLICNTVQSGLRTVTQPYYAHHSMVSESPSCLVATMAPCQQLRSSLSSPESQYPQQNPGAVIYQRSKSLSPTHLGYQQSGLMAAQLSIPDVHRSVLVHTGSPSQSSAVLHPSPANQQPSPVIHCSPTTNQQLRCESHQEFQHIMCSENFTTSGARPSQPQVSQAQRLSPNSYPTVIQQQRTAKNGPPVSDQKEAVPTGVTVKQEQNLDQAYLDDGKQHHFLTLCYSSRLHLCEKAMWHLSSLVPLAPSHLQSYFLSWFGYLVSSNQGYLIWMPQETMTSGNLEKEAGIRAFSRGKIQAMWHFQFQEHSFLPMMSDLGLCGKYSLRADIFKIVRGQDESNIPMED
ncbi:Nuclear factor of activated T-cells, cytoplasmic 2 [Varanus komodoensis]|nr:Nuclear factor of activated T-cells, cytoplasmic 2 [Varanus komodoensis]